MPDIKLPITAYHRTQNIMRVGVIDARGRSIARTNSAYYGTTDEEAVETAEWLRHRVNLHDRLVKALRRIGSMEAMTDGGIVDSRRDSELLARIDFARTTLAECED